MITATLKLGSLSNQLNKASASQCEAEGSEFIADGRLIISSKIPGEGYVRRKVGCGGGWDFSSEAILVLIV